MARRRRPAACRRAVIGGRKFSRLRGAAYCCPIGRRVLANNYWPPSTRRLYWPPSTNRLWGAHRWPSNIGRFPVAAYYEAPANDFVLNRELMQGIDEKPTLGRAGAQPRTIADLKFMSSQECASKPTSANSTGCRSPYLTKIILPGREVEAENKD